jgi:hypothetical protein
MSSPDYLADAEVFLNAPLDPDRSHLAATLALLGIGQQLRRIADQGEKQARPTLDDLDDNMATYTPTAKSYASTVLAGTGSDRWDIEDVWDVIAAAYDKGQAALS